MKTSLLLILLTFGGLAKAEPITTHGMLLFGKNQTYASHLPMFGAPHNYQVILKITLGGNLETLKKYAVAKTAAPEGFFTIVPQPFDLKQLLSGKLTQLSASLYQGHFEKQGVNLGPIQMHVDKIIFNKKLDANENAMDKNQYLAFGEAGEYFASHVITSHPSFDAVMSITPLMKTSDWTCHGRRVCGEIKKTPILDAALPMIVEGPGQVGSTTPPQMDYGVGDPLTGTANIQHLIYFTTDDLTL